MVKTDTGKPVTTIYDIVAKRISNDLKEQGYTFDRYDENDNLISGDYEIIVDMHNYISEGPPGFTVRVVEKGFLYCDPVMARMGEE